MVEDCVQFDTRQRFRVIMRNIEKADEILDLLCRLANTFPSFSGTFNNTNYNTVFSFPIEEGSTIMFQFSLVANEINNTDRAGFVRTRIVYRTGTNPAQIQGPTQTDFTEKSSETMDVRVILDGNNLVLQVINTNPVVTKWDGTAIVSVVEA